MTFVSSLRRWAVVLAALAGLVLAGPARAEADFFRNKVVRIIVGFGAGGGYDVFARVVARHLTRYIPGNPSVIVENRIGAGGVIAADAVYNTVPKDGTVIGLLPSNIVLDQAFEMRPSFDVRKFNWLGAGSDDFLVCLMRTDAGINGIEDAREKSVPIAAQSAGSLSYAVPALLNDVAGTKFHIIGGHRSIPDQFMAVVRNDAVGLCQAYYAVVLATQKANLEGDASPKYKIFVAVTEKPVGQFLQGVPSAISFARDEASRAMTRSIRLVTLISYPFALPPGVDKSRISTIRAALAATFADPEFISEANRSGQVVKPSSGPEVEKIVEELLSMPPAVVQKLRPILGKK